MYFIGIAASLVMTSREEQKLHNIALPGINDLNAYSIYY